jgi:hypothetical protein
VVANGGNAQNSRPSTRPSESEPEPEPQQARSNAV